jgi:flagellar biogenesis protein FliO
VSDLGIPVALIGRYEERFMGKMAKKSFWLSLTCAMAMFASAVRAEESDSILKAGDKPGKFEFDTKTSTKASAAPANTDAGTGQSLRLMGLWLLLFGAGAGTLVLWYRKQKGLTLNGKPSKKLEIVERLALGQRREIIVLKACDRVLIVASHADQTTLLSDLAGEGVDPAPFGQVYTREGLQDNVSKVNDRVLRAEAEVRANVANAKPKATAIAQPWPELESA